MGGFFMRDRIGGIFSQALRRKACPLKMRSRPRFAIKTLLLVVILLRGWSWQLDRLFQPQNPQPHRSKKTKCGCNCARSDAKALKSLGIKHVPPFSSVATVE